MIDHVGFPVSHYDRSKAFYLAALAPLGYALMMEITNEQTGGQGDHELEFHRWTTAEQR